MEKVASLDDLKRLPHWIVRDAHKQPYTPRTGVLAKAGIPTTWGSYKDAVTALTKYPDRYAGLGYEFLKENGITGIDLDHCVNDDGSIDQWALDILQSMKSYAEYSPNDGIHIFVYATLPDECRHKFPLKGMRHEKAAVEMYDHGRYFTITGRQLPNTPDSLESRQDQLDSLRSYLEVPYQKKPTRAQLSDLSDHELIEKACHASNGSKFAALWRGDISGYGDDSAADQAFCNLLAFWTKRDAARMDRIFRQSGLYREKWDRNARSGEKYGEGTIARAIASCTDVYDPSYLKSQIDEGLAHIETLSDHTGKPRPQIILGGQLRNIRDESLEALALAEKDHPTIFIQSARLVQIGRDESKKAIIMHMGVSEMRNALTRSADFYRIKKEDGSLSHALPPKDIADTIIALDPAQWPFQPLEAIVETPVIRPDGTILDTPGYDEQTRLYYAPHKNMQDCKVPLNPTNEEVQEALAILEDVIADFPFPDDADKANTLALMMTPVIRPAIKRHVPQALIDAPKQGTGKGLLSDAISIIATGEPASILTAPTNDDEWDKRITALLMSGATVITIDNIPSKLQSATLDAVLTASWWTSRILGFSKMIKVPQRATWIATGNNIRLGGDLARRCYRIRLDPKVSKPWMRTGFKHDDLATYVSEHRSRIVSAILTVVRGWYAAGCPIDPNVPSLGTFTGWAKMVGSILAFVGVPGFLTNLDKLYDEMDEENTQWANFLQSWMDVFGSESITVAALHTEITKEPDVFAGSDENVAGSAISDFLPDYLQTALREKPKSFKQILGKQLEKRLETCFGDDNLRLERQRDVHNKIAKWRVVAGSAGSNPTPNHTQRKTENRDSLIYSNGLDYSPHSPQAILTQDVVSSIDQPVEPIQQISIEFSENRLPASSESLPANLPDRECIRCGVRDWRWDAVLEIAVCMGCSK